MCMTITARCEDIEYDLTDKNNRESIAGEINSMLFVPQRENKAGPEIKHGTNKLYVVGENIEYVLLQNGFCISVKDNAVSICNAFLVAVARDYYCGKCQFIVEKVNSAEIEDSAIATEIGNYLKISVSTVMRGDTGSAENKPMCSLSLAENVDNNQFIDTVSFEGNLLQVNVKCEYSVDSLNEVNLSRDEERINARINNIVKYMSGENN